MITAKEAREKVNSLETEKGRKEKEQCEKAITTAVEKGEEHCWVGGNVSDQTKRYFESLGYKVECLNDQREGDSTNFIW